jgi:hypothetical protein
MEKSGFNIKDVYYSLDEKTIVSEKFVNMMDSPLTLMSRGDRELCETKSKSKGKSKGKGKK